ncbi:MAG: flippase-like domain-containing protein [Syntrophales bacterium]|nr:flippase-like domain-containing protein [Syntrophales bacterium]
MRKIILGLIISAVLVYLSFRGIDKRALLQALKGIDYLFIFLSVIILLLMQLVRSVRWGFLIAPLQKVPQSTLFAITSVGFLAIVAIPARIGELARPYLITKKTSIPMSSALATIFMERILDSTVVLLISAFALLLTPLPSWLVNSGLVVLTITFFAILIILLLYTKRELIFSRLYHRTSHLSKGWEGVIHTFRRFIEGFKVIDDYRRLILAVILSLFFWMIDAFSIYLFFYAFHLELPFIAAIVLMLILLVGIIIPTAPGFIGNWHFACVLGLSLFGVPKATALSFAIVYHFVSMVVIVGLGLIFLPSYTFKLVDLKRALKG